MATTLSAELDELTRIADSLEEAHDRISDAVQSGHVSQSGKESLLDSARYLRVAMGEVAVSARRIEKEIAANE